MKKLLIIAVCFGVIAGIQNCYAGSSKTKSSSAQAQVNKYIQDLKHGTRDVKISAAQALGGIGPAAKDAIPALIETLKDEDECVSGEAGIALGKIGATAVPALIKMLKDGDDQVRHSAAWVLGSKIGSPAVPALIKTLGDKKWGVRASAVEALGQIGPAAKDALPVLIKILRNGDEVECVRGEAAIAIGEIHNTSAVPELIETLGDEKWSLRLSAAGALSKIGDTSAVPALIVASKDENRNVRYAAVWALGKIGDKSAVPALIEALKEEDKNARQQAIRALGEIGDTAALEALTCVAENDKDKDVRSAAEEAIKKINLKATIKKKN